MSQRFFAPSMQRGKKALIEGAEAHHLLNVMRAKIGDEVTLFDGQGHEASASIVGRDKKSVELEVGPIVAVDLELGSALTIAVALPKGDRQKWLVEKLTELGVTTLVPIVTEHSNVPPSDNAIEKLRRVVVEACKQCGRNRLMEIAATVSFAEFVASSDSGCDRVIAHPRCAPLVGSDEFDSVCVAIGPEGGFSESEVNMAMSAGWRLASFAPAILRIETAAVAAAAILGAGLQSWSEIGTTDEPRHGR